MAVLATLTVLLGLSSCVSAQRTFPFSICTILWRDGACYLNECPPGTTRQAIHYGGWLACEPGTHVCCRGEPEEPAVDECQNADICGQIVPGQRISFANNEVPRQSPWQASIRRILVKGGGLTLENSFHSAGGVLINKNFVLLDATATSRAVKLMPDDNWADSAIVVFGDYNTRFPEFINGATQEQIFQIKSVTYHPAYNYPIGTTFPEILLDSLNNVERHQSYAFALIELASPVEYNNWVRPICLPPVEPAPTCNEFRDCKITGWGINENTETNDILSVAYVDEFTKGGCEAIEFYGSGRSVVLPEGTKCAISSQSSLAYIGDFGGPLACTDVSNSYRTTLSGIITFNIEYNQTNYNIISDVTSTISDWAWTTCRSKLGK